MKPIYLILVLSCVALSALAQPGRSTSSRFGGVLSSGPLPELNAVTVEGTSVDLRALTKGKYTLLCTGCLTCPEFHRSYAEIEAANVDYAPKGVQFFYVYKSLRHPELGGYMEAYNMPERLLQLAEARRSLGTKVPWLADTMDDNIRIALRCGSRATYLISPEGEILAASSTIHRESLRAALDKAVGPVETPTLASAIELPRVERPARQFNQTGTNRVVRPEGLKILSSVPAKPEETHFVKLRAEAEPALLSTGSGRLYLGFYPDPILKAHWNNLAPPMRYEIVAPEGVTVTPAIVTAADGKGKSDSEARQFWVDVSSEGVPADMTLTLHYFGCNDKICMPLTHEYTLSFIEEDRGARTYGFNRGSRGGARGTQGLPGRGRPQGGSR